VTGTTIINDGTISGGAGRAIDVDGGAAYLDNNDTIYGAVDLTDNADHFENDGLWEAYGTSTFGLGADDVDNDGTVGFSRFQGAASTTTFTGLENFDNFALVTGVDGQVGDSLNIDGAFNGGAGSQPLGGREERPVRIEALARDAAIQHLRVRPPERVGGIVDPEDARDGHGDDEVGLDPALETALVAEDTVLVP